jgi:hypothetical protein
MSVQDEAGQYSLALWRATCARSVVLVGDPNQLAMVTQGVHRRGRRVVARTPGRRLGDGAADRGFSEATRRLHPRVNASHPRPS